MIPRVDGTLMVMSLGHTDAQHCYKLWAAVLDRALADLSYGRIDRLRAWLASRSDARQLKESERQFVSAIIFFFGPPAASNLKIACSGDAGVERARELAARTIKNRGLNHQSAIVRRACGATA